MHYLCIVIVPSVANREEAADELEGLLAPFDEDREVEPYLRTPFEEMWHGGERTLHTDSTEETIREEGLRHYALRAKTGGLLPWKPDDAFLTLLLSLADYAVEDDQEEARLRGLRTSRLWAEVVEAYTGCTVDPTTGDVMTTDNPRSQWDWWQVGGRWSGFFAEDGYDPTTDPDNIETCDVCAGTGRRDDALGRAERERDPSYTCNGCGGKGTRTKWPTQWRAVGSNVVPLARYVNRLRGDPESNLTPFALLGPDGAWRDRYVHPDTAGDYRKKDDATWRGEVEEAVAAYLEQHPDALAVAVDCHF